MKTAMHMYNVSHRLKLEKPRSILNSDYCLRVRMLTGVCNILCITLLQKFCTKIVLPNKEKFIHVKALRDLVNFFDTLIMSDK